MDNLTKTLGSLGLDSVPKIDSTPSFPDCNQLDIFRAHIAQLLEPVTGVSAKQIVSVIQWTQVLEHGDLMLPVPALRIKGKKPDEIAQDIVSKFPESPLVQPPKADKSFVRFSFKPDAITRLTLPTILSQKEAYGYNKSLGLRDPTKPDSGPLQLIVEFASPNIAKTFHAGHLRSTIIGGFISNLYEGAGWNVVRMNYLGDWGKQYGVLAVGFEEYGDEAALLANPIGHLHDVYVRINAVQAEEEETIKRLQEQAKVNPSDASTEAKASVGGSGAEEITKIQENGVDERARRYFKRMCDGDKDAVALWKKFRDLSIVKYKQTFARLNIHFDDYSGESQVLEEDMEAAGKVMADRKVSEISNGAVIVNLEPHSKKLGKALVRKRDGTSLYLTRDIAANKERMDKYHYDKMIYVIACQQDLHVAQLFKILELMGGEYEENAKKCEHVNFGMVKGMSTRRGTAKFLDDILKDVGDKMHEVMRTNENKYALVEDPEKTADMLGITAVMVQDMTGKRINGYTFDMDRMTSFEGDTGPYLQYAHARLCSIARRADLSPDELLTADWSLLLTEKHAVDLTRYLAQWPDVFLNTYKTREPITVLTYLFKMTHMLSSGYEVEGLQVVKAEAEMKKALGALYECARQVLNNGMRLLGLTPVDRM